MILAPILLLAAVFAQRGAGELRIAVRDTTGAPLAAAGELVNQARQVRTEFTTNGDGRYTARDLPFGNYVLRVRRANFVEYSALIEVRSEVPIERVVTLAIAAIETTVVVTDSSTLLDPHQTGAVFRLGPETLREQRSAQPARALLEAVQSQPGWLLEANGVLHPRGSEYETQYVIDGVPIADNRSPAFAPAFEIEEVDSVSVFTANFPAEYGRRLGGVVEVTTARDPAGGFRGKAEFGGGSFNTQTANVTLQQRWEKSLAGLAVQAARTDRYLDPPAEENYTNDGSLAGLTARFEHEPSPSDRVRGYIHRKRTAFLIPNEEMQQIAGQRQDRNSEETMGHVSWQRVLSARAMLSARGMARDLSAGFWSNPLAMPIIADQRRGFGEGYATGSISAHLGGHELKAGMEGIFASLREQFHYRITGTDLFDDDIPAEFAFAGRQRGNEQSAFVQDLFRMGRWTFSAGLRWDRYSLLLQEQAVSPRLGVAWHWPDAGVVLRASYDRAFQIPAIENLLLASSEAAQRLAEEGASLAVPPSRGNFFQAGFSKSLLGRLRLDANYFRRNIRDFADDDVLLNTGVSFPISFARAQIHGFEAKLEMPRWGPLSGFVTYSNLSGTGFLPITGGLFLEEDAADLLRSRASFPITQDQRNTAHARLRWQLTPRVWAALGASYGSGLPIEREGDEETIAASERVLSRVNLDRGRVRPSYSLDAAGGIELWREDSRSVRLQADVTNLTDRLNVINFAGLFSGTALAAPRSLSVRLQLDF